MVKASDCGSDMRGFESPRLPHFFHHIWCKPGIQNKDSKTSSACYNLTMPLDSLPTPDKTDTTALASQRMRATLRIYHPDLAPDEITGLLQIEPTVAWSAGQDQYGFRKRPGHLAPSGGWLLSSRATVKNNVLQDHILHLLEQISGSHTILKALQQRGYMVDIVVSWHATNWNPTPAIFPALMRQLARFDLPVWFDIYQDDSSQALVEESLPATRPEETYATFRLYHPELDPDEISALMQLKATRQWRMGEQLVPIDGERPRTANLGGWLLSSRDRVKSTDAARHLEFLLDCLQGSGSCLRSLIARGYKMDVVVAWFSDSWNTCPAITPQVMQKLAALDLELWFDVYLDEWA